MQITAKTLAAAALALGLAACGSPPADQVASEGEAAAPATSEAAAPAAGPPAAIATCAVCHSPEPGKNGIGPSLAGVFGRKAGEAPGFTYSDAIKKAGLTWDEATLEKFLSGPAKLVPGTKMTYVGTSDPAQLKEQIEFLKTLK